MKCGVINLKVGLLIKVVFLLDSNTTSIKQQSLKLDKTKRPQKQNRTKINVAET